MRPFGRKSPGRSRARQAKLGSFKRPLRVRNSEVEGRNDWASAIGIDHPRIVADISGICKSRWLVLDLAQERRLGRRSRQQRVKVKQSFPRFFLPFDSGDKCRALQNGPGLSAWGCLRSGNAWLEPAAA